MRSSPAQNEAPSPLSTARGPRGGVSATPRLGDRGEHRNQGSCLVAASTTSAMRRRSRRGAVTERFDDDGHRASLASKISGIHLTCHPTIRCVIVWPMSMAVPLPRRSPSSVSTSVPPRSIGRSVSDLRSTRRAVRQPPRTERMRQSPRIVGGLRRHVAMSHGTTPDERSQAVRARATAPALLPWKNVEANVQIPRLNKRMRAMPHSMPPRSARCWSTSASTAFAAPIARAVGRHAAAPRWCGRSPSGPRCC